MPGSQLVELFVTRCDLLEEVSMGVGFEGSKVHVIFSVSLPLVLVNHDLSSKLLFPNYACLPAAIFPTMRLTL